MDCLFEDTGLVGLVHGYALDGHEMLRPWVCANEACSETREVTSSYVRVDDGGLGAFDAWEYQAGAGDLDGCNGMIGADGEYHYYITDEFPYVTFCYHGLTGWAQGDFDGEAPAAGPGGANALPAIGGQDGVIPLVTSRPASPQPSIGRSLATIFDGIDLATAGDTWLAMGVLRALADSTRCTVAAGVAHA